jgi:hypothetical protein
MRQQYTTAARKLRHENAGMKKAIAASTPMTGEPFRGRADANGT